MAAEFRLFSAVSWELPLIVTKSGRSKPASNELFPYESGRSLSKHRFMRSYQNKATLVDPPLFAISTGGSVGLGLRKDCFALFEKVGILCLISLSG